MNLAGGYGQRFLFRNSFLIKFLSDNPELVKILKEIDSSRDPELTLEHYYEEPLVAEFVRSCLKVIPTDPWLSGNLFVMKSSTQIIYKASIQRFSMALADVFKMKSNFSSFDIYFSFILYNPVLKYILTNETFLIELYIRRF